MGTAAEHQVQLWRACTATCGFTTAWARRQLQRLVRPRSPPGSSRQEGESHRDKHHAQGDEVENKACPVKRTVTDDFEALDSLVSAGEHGPLEARGARVSFGTEELLALDRIKRLHTTLQAPAQEDRGKPSDQDQRGQPEEQIWGLLKMCRAVERQSSPAKPQGWGLGCGWDAARLRQVQRSVSRHPRRGSQAKLAAVTGLRHESAGPGRPAHDLTAPAPPGLPTPASAAASRRTSAPGTAPAALASAQTACGGPHGAGLAPSVARVGPGTSGPTAEAAFIHALRQPHQPPRRAESS